MESKYEVFRQQEAKMNRALDRLAEKRVGEGPHKFEPSGLVESCGDGCCREETCAFCRQHEDANPDHED